MLSIPGLGLATSDLGLGANVINTVVKRGQILEAIHSIPRPGPQG